MNRRTVPSVARNVGFSPIERNLLIAALMPAQEEGFLRAYMRVWGDYLKREPDVAFLCSLVALNAEEVRLARLALEPDSRLVTLRLLTTHEPEGNPGVSYLRRSVRVADWLVRLALGHDRPAKYFIEPGEIAKRIAPAAAEVHSEGTRRCAEFLGRQDSAGVFVLYGDDRDDLLAVTVAACRDRPLFLVRVREAQDEPPAEACR